MKELIIKLLGMIAVWTDVVIGYIESKSLKTILAYVGYGVLGIATIWSFYFWIVILSNL